MAFPTEFNTPCPFPAFPYYKENWHSGPCPPCQLAKSLEGRCSISDITIKISLSFWEEPFPARFLHGNWHLALLWHIVTPASSSLWSRQSRLRWVCQQEHPLTSSLLPTSLSPLFSPSESFINNCNSEAKRTKVWKRRIQWILNEFAISPGTFWLALLVFLVNSQVASLSSFLLLCWISRPLNYLPSSFSSRICLRPLTRFSLNLKYFC